MKLTIVLCLFSLIFAGYASANAKSKKYVNKENLRQEYKCYIELVGGKKTIQFVAWKGTKSKTELTKQLGPTVDVQLSKQQGVIYNVQECVKADARFKNPQARYLEKDMVW